MHLRLAIQSYAARSEIMSPRNGGRSSGSSPVNKTSLTSHRTLHFPMPLQAGPNHSSSSAPWQADEETVGDSATSSFASLFQHCLVEFVPVVEIVQIDGIFRGGCAIRNCGRPQNTFSSVVIVVIPANCRVMFLDCGRCKRFRVLLYPRLKLRIGRLVLLDEIFHCLLIQTQCCARHCIEAPTNARIPWRELTRRLERNLLPKTRKMKNPKWTGGAGAN